MMTRRWTLIGALELYALALAWMQSLAGVRTDEAKYLLDIPYPHPPLLRGLFHALEALPFQELVLRFLMASLVVQSVWLAVSFVAHRPFRVQWAIAMAWLLSAPVLLQAGSIMMAPATAIQAMVCLWLIQRPRRSLRPYVGWIVLFWTSMLFTAYQGVLFLPLMWAIFKRAELRRWPRLLAVFGPIALLGLYTLANPLLLASIIIVGSREAVSFLSKLQGPLITAFIGGSIVLFPAGLTGIMAAKRGDLLMSFVLVFAYVFLSFQGYYAILFLPLLIAGTAELLSRWPKLSVGTVGAVALCSAILLWYQPPVLTADPSRETMRLLEAEGIEGEVAIKGSFGHQWQYESRLPIRRFTDESGEFMDAVICLDACPELEKLAGWRELEGAPVTVWMRE